MSFFATPWANVLSCMLHTAGNGQRARGYLEGVLFYSVTFGGGLLGIDPANERGVRLFDELVMRTYTAVIERDPETGLLVGYVPGFTGGHAQADTLDELNRNLQEVIEMLLEDVLPALVDGAAVVQILLI